MGTTSDFMVAVELGSTRIMGIAGQRNADGGLTVLAYAQEDASSSVRKGMIFNIDKAAQAVTSIINKLEAALDASISQVYVGIGGQSLRTIGGAVSRQFDQDVRITGDMVRELVETDRRTQLDGVEILEVVPQEYKAGSGLHVDPVGVVSGHIEGRFLNVVARKGTRHHVESCFELARTRIAGYFVSPLEMARVVLTDAEMRAGCVLVDMGAETTTVMVYKDHLLRHLAVLPLGGDSVTRDICSLKIDEADAEELKIKYARAYTDVSDLDVHDTITYSYGADGQTVSDRRLSEVAEARMQEIVANVWHQVTLSGQAGGLMAGIVVTGGASGMSCLEQAFRAHTGQEKFRVASYVTLQVGSVVPEVLVRSGRMCTLLGLLASARESCRVEEVPASLFTDEGLAAVPQQADDDVDAVREALLDEQKAEAERIARETEVREAEARAAEAARIASEKADREAKDRAAAAAIAAAQRKEEEERIRRERHEKSVWGRLQRFGRRLADDILNGDE